MNITKLLTGALAGAVVLFLLSWLVYGNLLMHFMWNNPGRIGHVGRKEMEWVFLIAGYLLQGLLLAYVLMKSNVNGMMGGLVTGGALGFLMSMSTNCIVYATTQILSKKAFAAEVAVAVILFAIAGAVIGMVSGGKK
jgi:hypothetical protein